MNLARLHPLPLLALLLSLMAAPLWGQNLQTRRVSVPNAPNEKDAVRFDLDFPGGTLDEVLVALHQASGSTLTIQTTVANSPAPSFRLPALRYDSVTVGEVLRMIEVPFGHAAHGSFHRVIEYEHGYMEKDDLYILQIRLHPIRRETRFFRMPPGETAPSPDDVTTALATACEMLDLSPPQMKFHENSRLLIVVGTTEQLGVVDRLIATLQPPSN